MLHRIKPEHQKEAMKDPYHCLEKVIVLVFNVPNLLIENVNLLRTTKINLTIKAI